MCTCCTTNTLTHTRTLISYAFTFVSMVVHTSHFFLPHLVNIQQHQAVGWIEHFGFALSIATHDQKVVFGYCARINTWCGVRERASEITARTQWKEERHNTYRSVNGRCVSVRDESMIAPIGPMYHQPRNQIYDVGLAASFGPSQSSAIVYKQPDASRPLSVVVQRDLQSGLRSPIKVKS